ncbi:DUF3566 domain-containing protein [Micromonospora sp. CPCC 206060]|uniref:DUF3566 domain-containing protein n=1 Tax=Micromonospora sp. CPCC 206060 TaxID=3122406 RepID=UPI002FF41AE9
MTETQAKSGTAGTPAKPVDGEGAKGGTPAAGRAAVGRAAVPADAPAPKFTRAPGMAPPPDQPAEETGVQQPEKAGGDGAATATPTAAGTGTPGFTVPAGPNITAALPRDAQATGTLPRVDGARAPLGTAKPNGGGLPPGVGGAGGAAVGAARVNDAVRAARSTVSSAASRGPRRARLNLKRIDPWSVMKFAFAVSLVLFIVVIVATSVLYLALDAMGVFASVNDSLTDLVSAGGGQETSGFRITAKGVILSSALIGLVNVVLFTALATLGAFVYNVCADLVGGIELTLAERD